LNGNGQWPINNLAVMSDVSRAYAPEGRALISISVLGQPTQSDEELTKAIRAQLIRWFGREAASWQHLKTYRIHYAQPDVVPGPISDRPAKLATGLYVAGDHRHMPSIHFAMLSGRLAAEAVAADVTVRAAVTT
jgi:hypothetical protein